MNEILPFAATCLDLNCIMVSEKSHRRTNTVYYHLYVQSKNKWMTFDKLICFTLPAQQIALVSVKISNFHIIHQSSRTICT